MDSPTSDPFPIDRAALFHDVRILLKLPPRYIGDHVQPCLGEDCIETHLVGGGGPMYYSDFPAVEDRPNFSLFADYSHHSKSYTHAWACFPRIGGSDYIVNLDDALKPEIV